MPVATLLPLFAFVASLQAATIDTGALVAEVDGDQLSSLVVTASGAEWAGSTSTLVELGSSGLDAELSASALPDGQLLLSLTLSNPGSIDLAADLVFPRLSQLGEPDTPLAYLFPALGPILDDEITTHYRYYGALFPLQFMELHHAGGGLWMMTRDTAGHAKTYGLQKTSGHSATLWVDWSGVTVPAGGSLTLEASVGVHQDDWHSALDAYRRWVRDWFQPAAPRSSSFREAFNLRQLHLHENTVLGSHSGVFDPDAGSYGFSSFLAEDVAAFGGVDWVHVFDWGMDWVHGRVGDYVPFSYLGERELLVAELDSLQADGMGVGLYVEGYLLDTTSLTGLTHGDAWELENSSGGDYTTYAPSWHVCPAVPAWQEHFATYNARRTERRLGASGLYIDQIGYGYQYPCHRSGHDHSLPSAQVGAEAELLWAARRAMSPAQVIYSEAAPADVLRQISDGAFTEAIASFRDDARTVPVNLARFALPDFKTFELLTQDAPLGADVEGVRLAFFNGEGQRLMGYLEDDPWFEAATLSEIAQAWQVLRDHRAAFTSEAPVPLVTTASECVYANLFPAEAEDLWTLFSACEGASSGVILAVDSLPGESWSDCWSGDSLAPAVVDGVAQVELTMEPGGVGCVARSRPTSPATLVAHWALDELSGSTVADSAGSATGSLSPGASGPNLGGSAPHTRLGTALELDGVDDAVSLGSAAALGALTDDFSIAAWVRPDSTAGVQRILAVDGWTDGGLVFGLSQSGGQQAVALTTVGVLDYLLPAVVPAGRWTHLAVVMDGGGSVDFYLDGHLRGRVSHSRGGQASGADWWIGSNGSDGHFGGGLDDVRVYDGQLTAAEIRALADLEPPLAGWVKAADGVVEQADQVELWWPGFHDPGAGIQGYAACLGSTEGACDLLGSSDQGLAVSANLIGLSLPEGTIWATVQAVDGVGLTARVSAALEVDTTPPVLLGSWDLDHGDDPIELSLDLARQDRVSIAGWIAPATTGAMSVFGSSAGGWSFGQGGDGDDLVLLTHGLQDYTASVAIPTDAWTHVAAVFDRWADVHFYIDGAWVSTVHGALPALAASETLWVGDGVGPWQGSLRDLRLYDGELDADEIRQLADPGGDSGDSDPPVDSADSEPLEPDSDPDPDTGSPGDPERCGCGGTAPTGMLLALLGLGLASRRRFRARSRPGACGTPSGS